MGIYDPVLANGLLRGVSGRGLYNRDPLAPEEPSNGRRRRLYETPGRSRAVPFEQAQVAEPVAADDPGLLRKGVNATANVTLGGLAMVGNALDLPGSMIRDVATWVPGGIEAQNPFDQLLSPFSDKNRVSGEDILAKNGLLDEKRPDGFWANVPRFVAGVGTEIAMDPLTYTGLGLVGKAVGGLGKGGKAAMRAGLVDKSLDIAKDAAKAAGKDPDKVGWRLARQQVTGEDLIKAGDKKDLGERFEDRLRVAGATDETLKEPLGGLATFGIPFRDKTVWRGGIADPLGGKTRGMVRDALESVPGGGKVVDAFRSATSAAERVPGQVVSGQEVASLLDRGGEAVRFSAPGRIAAGMFSRAVRRTSGKEGQIAAEGLTAKEPGSRYEARSNMAPIARAIDESAVFRNADVLDEAGQVVKRGDDINIENSNAMMDYIEAGVPLPDNLKSLQESLDRYKELQEGYYKNLREAGSGIQRVGQVAQGKVAKNLAKATGKVDKITKNLDELEAKALADEWDPARLSRKRNQLQKQLAKEGKNASEIQKELDDLIDKQPEYMTRVRVDETGAPMHSGSRSRALQIDDPNAIARDPHLAVHRTSTIQKMSIDQDFAGKYDPKIIAPHLARKDPARPEFFEAFKTKYKDLLDEDPAIQARMFEWVTTLNRRQAEKGVPAYALDPTEGLARRGENALLTSQALRTATDFVSRHASEIDPGSAPVIGRVPMSGPSPTPMRSVDGPPIETVVPPAAVLEQAPAPGGKMPYKAMGRRVEELGKRLRELEAKQTGDINNDMKYQLEIEEISNEIVENVNILGIAGSSSRSPVSSIDDIRAVLSDPDAYNKAKGLASKLPEYSRFLDSISGRPITIDAVPAPKRPSIRDRVDQLNNVTPNQAAIPAKLLDILNSTDGGHHITGLLEDTPFDGYAKEEVRKFLGQQAGVPFDKIEELIKEMEVSVGSAKGFAATRTAQSTALPPSASLPPSSVSDAVPVPGPAVATPSDAAQLPPSPPIDGPPVAPASRPMPNAAPLDDATEVNLYTAISQVKEGNNDNYMGVVVGKLGDLGDKIRTQLKEMNPDPEYVPTNREILEALKIPREIADDFTKLITKPGQDPATGPVMNILNRYLNILKTNLTATNLGFHARNRGGGVVQNILHGVKDPTVTGPFKAIKQFIQPSQDWKTLARGGTVKRASEIPSLRSRWEDGQKIAMREAGDPNPVVDMSKYTDEVASEELRRAVFATGLMDSPGQTNDLIGTTGSKIASQFPGRDALVEAKRDPASLSAIERRLSPSQRVVLNQARPRKESRWRDILNPLAVKGGLGEVDDFALGRAGRVAGDVIEGRNRGEVFISALRQGYDEVEALKRANELHLDYSNLSEFERNAMRKAIPFYSYNRQMVPQVFNELTSSPGGPLAQTIRATNSLADPNEVTPEYIKDTVSLPLGKSLDGGRRYLTGFGLMHEGPLSLLSSDVGDFARKIMAQTSPLVKGFPELGANELYFQEGAGGGGRSLDDIDPPLGRLAANITGSETPYNFGKLTEYAVSNSPISRYVTQARQLTDTRKPLVDKGINFLTGARIATVSPATEDSVLRADAEATLKSLGSRNHITPYVPKDLQEKFTPEQQAQFEDARARLNLINSRSKARAKERKLAEENELKMRGNG
jgi:hypothetical protein